MQPSPDRDLRALLLRADPAADAAAADAAAFATGVRARIARQAAPDSWFGHFATLPRQLLPLAAALALLASVGAGSAVAFARHQRERTEFFANAYAVSVDPWLMHTSADQR